MAKRHGQFDPRDFGLKGAGSSSEDETSEDPYLEVRGPNFSSAAEKKYSRIIMLALGETMSVSVKDDNLGAKVNGPSALTGVQANNDGFAVMAGVKFGSVSGKIGPLDFEAKAPSASAAGRMDGDEVGVMVRSEAYSTTLRAGRVGVKVALGADTGASVGRDGVEAKFLGAGFKIGPTTSVSLLGFTVSWSF